MAELPIRTSKEGKQMITKYFITDVDGVILDRMPIYRLAFAEVLRPFGIPAESLKSYYYNSLGTPAELQMRGVLEENSISIDDQALKKLVEEFQGIGERHEIKIFSGVKETLQKIKEAGLFLMASSGSNTDELNKIFAKNGLPYDFVLGSDKILKSDKHIEIFAEHFSVAKDEFCRQALFVGDGTTDMQIASRNGIVGIGVANTLPKEKLLTAGAKAVISNISEVFDHLP